MNIPAEWYADPTHRHEWRYWDGSRWTDNVRDGAGDSIDPLSDDESATLNDPGPRPQTEVLSPEAFDPFASSVGLVAADTRSAYARAMLRGATIVGLVSLVMSVLPVLSVVGVAGGLVGFVAALRARQRLDEVGATGQVGALGAAAIGVLAALIGTVTTVMTAVLHVDGELLRFVACTESAPLAECIDELVRVAADRLVP